MAGSGGPRTRRGPQFVNLWKYTFNYLTSTKGLTNIIWLMPFSGSPNAAYYPGKAFVDIGGPDEYSKPANLLTFTASGNYNPAANIFGSSMPIALHETGSALQPDSIFPAARDPLDHVERLGDVRKHGDQRLHVQQRGEHAGGLREPLHHHPRRDPEPQVELAGRLAMPRPVTLALSATCVGLIGLLAIFFFKKDKPPRPGPPEERDPVARPALPEAVDASAGAAPTAAAVRRPPLQAPARSDARHAERTRRRCSSSFMTLAGSNPESVLAS